MFVVGWVLFKDVYGHGGSKPLAWVDLTSQFGRLRFDHPGARMIRGPITLRAFLREHGDRAAVHPPIDFHRRDVVLVTSGPRSATGYELRIVRVTEQRRRVVVTVREETPRLGQTVRAGLRYPYRLVTIPKLGKAFYVETLGRP